MENSRISKTENGEETRFVYNTNNQLSQLIMETDSSGNPTAYYIYGVGLVSKINIESNGSGQLGENTYYYHFDRRGSTVAMTDLQEDVVNSYKYDIYGELIEEVENVYNSLQYNGQYGVYTDDNGLYYMRSRYYSPEIKRFINRDVIAGSILESQSLNRFAYVNGNPISFIDPFGLERETDTKKKVTWTQILDGTQLVLSVVGFIPVLGEIADIVNALISLGRGDVAGALLDIASAIPGAGNVVAAGRVAVKAGKVASDAGKVADVGKTSNKVNEVDNPYSTEQPCPLNCFVEGTLVLTDKGHVPVEEIKIGDLVLAKNDETGSIDYKKVVKTFNRETKEIYSLFIGEEEISVTGEHPFWVEGEGWVETSELEVGDLLTTFDGLIIPISDIIITEELTIVYNFEVEDYHTYYVSKIGIWTHNCGGTKTYEIYQKYNPQTDETYIGRTSGTNGAAKNVENRDRNHHMNKKGFQPAELLHSSEDKDVIRGLEQILIEQNGGAKSQGGTSGNAVNGVSDKNKNRNKYLEAGNKFLKGGR